MAPASTLYSYNHCLQVRDDSHSLVSNYRFKCPFSRATYSYPRHAGSRTFPCYSSWTRQGHDRLSFYFFL